MAPQRFEMACVTGVELLLDSLVAEGTRNKIWGVPRSVQMNKPPNSRISGKGSFLKAGTGDPGAAAERHAGPRAVLTPSRAQYLGCCPLPPACGPPRAHPISFLPQSAPTCPPNPAVLLLTQSGIILHTSLFIARLPD